MGTYKVIQDIEAEDKLLGPLTLKQFIFASITAICLYLSFFLITKGLAWLTIVLLPPAIFFAILAVPWSKTQPTEVWLLAKIRYFFKPRKRIWDQTGMKELVTITVPKKIEEHLTDGLSQTEVRSRLSALANTIDSRGWAVKNASLNLYPQPAYAGQGSDRLIDASNIPQDVPFSDVTLNDDMMDEQNNSTAQNLNRMLELSEKTRRDRLVASMQQPQAPAQSTQQQDYWFMSQNDPASIPQGMATVGSQVVHPGTQDDTSASVTTQDEQALLEKIHKSKSKKTRNTHLKTIKPLSEQQEEAAPSPPAKAQKKSEEKPAGTPPQDPAILGLANRDDLNVATIARVANKQDEPPVDEVVVKLH